MARAAGTDKDLLTMAVVGYEAEKDRLIAAIAEIRARLGTATDGPARKKRTMSAAARRRMAAGQRKRWAALKKSQAQGKSTATASKQRKLSAAGRKAIIAATRKRWAAYRKGAGKKAA